jgi:hypothetical protein
MFQHTVDIALLNKRVINVTAGGLFVEDIIRKFLDIYFTLANNIILRLHCISF